MSELMESRAIPRDIDGPERKPIRHVNPGITISQDGITIETLPDMRVRICSQDGSSKTGEITLSQRQYLNMIRWLHIIVHEDWE